MTRFKYAFGLGFLVFFALLKPLLAHLEYRAVESQEDRRILSDFIEEDKKRRTNAIVKKVPGVRQTSFGDTRVVIDDPDFRTYALVETKLLGEKNTLTEAAVRFLYALSPKAYVLFFTRYEEDSSKTQTMQQTLLSSFQDYVANRNPPAYGGSSDPKKNPAILFEGLPGVNDWVTNGRFWQDQGARFTEAHPGAIFGVSQDQISHDRQSFELTVGEKTVYARYNEDDHRLDPDEELQEQLSKTPSFPPQTIKEHSKEIPPTDPIEPHGDPFINVARAEYRLELNEERIRFYKEVARHYLIRQDEKIDTSFLEGDRVVVIGGKDCQNPYYFMTAGLPASGKSSLRKLWISGLMTPQSPYLWVAIDIDELKEIFVSKSGMPKDTNSAIFHTEAGIVASALSQLIAKTRQYNLWIDGTFRWSGLIDRLAEFEREKFTIGVVYAYADLRTLLARGAARGTITGRGIPPIALAQPAAIDMNLRRARKLLPYMPIFKFASSGEGTTYGGLDFLDHIVQADEHISFSPKQLENSEELLGTAASLRKAFDSDMERARELVKRAEDVARHNK